jgi:Arc/MetJ-type ribon-helix-helix transcriptional regulator
MGLGQEIQGGNKMKYGYKDPTPLKIITINISEKQRKMIDILRQNGIITSRSEGMRMMLAEWLDKKISELKLMDKLIERFDKLDIDEEETVRIPNGDGTETQYHVVRRLE